jgi:hypothetical protein
LACSVYASDDALVRAMAQSNSHGRAFAVIDAAALADPIDPHAEPRTLQVAMARLEEIRAGQGRPLLGWMQLPPEWLTMFGRELREGFDPCVNISIGTAMLSAFDYECSIAAAALPAPQGRRARGRGPNVPRLDRRACVVRKYGEAIGMADFAVVTTLELRYQRSSDETPATSASIQVAEGTGPWGAHGVFVPLRLAGRELTGSGPQTSETP